MKKFVLWFCIFPVFISYSQKLEYSISAGPNFSFFSNSHEVKKTEGVVIIQAWPNYEDYLGFESKGKLGFFINGKLGFSLSRNIGVVSGLGFSYKRIGSKINYFPPEEWVDSVITIVWGNGDPVTFTPIPSLDSREDIDIYQFYCLNVPLLLQFKLLNEKLRFVGGIELTKIFIAGAKNNSSGNIYNAIDNIKTLIPSMRFGIEYGFINDLYLGFYFDRNLSSLNKKNMDYTDDNFILYKAFPESFDIKINTISIELTYQF